MRRDRRPRASFVRWTVATLVAGVAAGVVGALPGRSVLADLACGSDGQPVCPVIDRIDPALLRGAQKTDVEVHLLGTFANVTAVILEPPGTPLKIVSQSPAEVVVIIPARSLGVGAVERLALRVAGQDSDAAVSQPVSVVDTAAAAPAQSLPPAPVVADVPAASAPAALPQRQTATAAPQSGAGPLRIAFFLLLGLALGCGVVYLVALRTGLLYEVAYFRDRRDRNDHKRAMSEIDRNLAALWAGGGDVVPAGARITPEVEQRTTGHSRPTRQQLDTLRSSLAAALDSRRSRSQPQDVERIVPAGPVSQRPAAAGPAPVATTTAAEPAGAWARPAPPGDAAAWAMPPVGQPAPSPTASEDWAAPAAPASAWPQPAQSPPVPAPARTAPPSPPVPSEEENAQPRFSWSVREQSKPVGSPERFRRPPH